MEKRIEVSVNGAEKQKLEWKTFSSGGSFGFDNDREILPRMQNIVIRGILGARETSTFRFDWDNWQEPIQFLEENGCAW